jgi:hypothetical protein
MEAAMRSNSVRYVGYRGEDDRPIIFVEERGKRIRLTHVKVHAAGGMDWGKKSGPAADLAHSILTHYLEMKRVSPQLYQAFMNEVIGDLSHKGFVMPIGIVREWVNRRWSGMADDDIRADLVG